MTIKNHLFKVFLGSILFLLPVISYASEGDAIALYFGVIFLIIAVLGLIFQVFIAKFYVDAISKKPEVRKWATAIGLVTEILGIILFLAITFSIENPAPGEILVRILILLGVLPALIGALAVSLLDRYIDNLKGSDSKLPKD